MGLDIELPRDSEATSASEEVFREVYMALLIYWNVRHLSIIRLSEQ